MLSSALSCSASYPASFMPTISRTVMCSAASSVRFAVVGDVHGQWCPNRDAAALHALNADMTLFVGDIGNEKVTLVQQIADLDVRKAVILVRHCGSLLCCRCVLLWYGLPANSPDGAH